MRHCLLRYQAQGVSRVIVGDLFLRNVRQYRETNPATLNMHGIFPLWLKDTRQLAHDFIAAEFRAVVVLWEGI